MASLSASSNAALPSLTVSLRSTSELSLGGRIRLTKSQPFRQTQLATCAHRPRAAMLVCAASALNARCAAEQTQTVTRQSSTITIAPIQGKEKSPDLDDGGTGRRRGWSGGFFFFGFLAFLGFLQDKERDGDYRDQKRRYSRSY
ncbi:unnamed protein product [Spirodela intermedia]|uniref:Uncharacterized protein n=1 Tax=Spirodela intermedia TaxID=51605 RepID=A0A7I8IKK8_SPIIN|nr:unnamed protein product [Spirodela intermedia]CAA6657943.1 unnamed protein product [Spirodela intermedia]